MELQQIADRVWVYPFDPALQDRQPNVGVVITRKETVLIDNGAGPGHARQIQAALRSRRAPKVRYVIYTHHHFDHTFGGQVWAGSTVIAHELCRLLLKERYGAAIDSDLSLDEQIRQDPPRVALLGGLSEAIGAEKDFQLVLPEVVFSQDLSLSLDGLTLELQHVGGHHAADSITVLVEEARVMFLGDCYYPAPGQGEYDPAVIETVLAQPTDHFIEGHNKPMTHKAFARHIQVG